MLATLTIPIIGLCSLLLVALANIAVGAYLCGVLLKASFKRVNYRVSYRTLIVILDIYVALLCGNRVSVRNFT